MAKGLGMEEAPSRFVQIEVPYAPMQAAALARGYDLSALRARQFDVADFTRFDLILAMDGDNLAMIEQLRPGGRPRRCGCSPISPRKPVQQRCPIPITPARSTRRST